MPAKAQDPANLFVCRSLESLGCQMTETSVLEHKKPRESHQVVQHVSKSTACSGGWMPAVHLSQASVNRHEATLLSCRCRPATAETACTLLLMLLHLYVFVIVILTILIPLVGIPLVITGILEYYQYCLFFCFCCWTENPSLDPSRSLATSKVFSGWFSLDVLGVDLSGL